MTRQISKKTPKGAPRGAGGRQLRRLIAGTTILSLSACSAITHPYVIQGDDLTINPTLTEALEYAKDKRKKLQDRLIDLDQYETTTGAVAFGSAISALAFGIFRSHTDAVLGAGLVGGSAYGARSFVPTAARKTIYAKGAEAVSCAIRVTALGGDFGDSGGQAERDGTPETSRLMAAESGGSAETSALMQDQAGKAFLGAIQRLKSINLRPSIAQTKFGNSSAPESGSLGPVRPDRSVGSDTPKAVGDQGASSGFRSMRTLAPMVFPTTDPLLIGRAATLDSRILDVKESIRSAESAKKALESAALTLTVGRAHRLVGATDAILAATILQLSGTSTDPEAAVKALNDHYTSVQTSLNSAGGETEKSVKDGNDSVNAAELAVTDLEATLEQNAAAPAGTFQPLSETGRTNFESQLRKQRDELDELKTKLSETADATNDLRNLTASLTACLDGLKPGESQDDGDGKT